MLTGPFWGKVLLPNVWPEEPQEWLSAEVDSEDLDLPFALLELPWTVFKRPLRVLPDPEKTGGDCRMVLN